MRYNSNININIFLSIVVTIGLTLSFMSYYFFANMEEKSLIIEFQRDVDERAASMYREILVNFEVLQSLSLLFYEGTEPDLIRFQQESRKILNRHGDIQALEWIPKVAQSQRQLHESEIRKYFPGYEISERREQGIMERAGQRKEYFPVYYIEPLVGNEAALGFDLASNPTRLKALTKARDLGSAQATASITLVQERQNKKGFLIFLPIYNGNSSTVERRREELEGFILGVFRIGDIFITSALSEIVQGIDMSVVDNTSTNVADILYTYKPGSAITYKEVVYRKDLPEIWGRKWSIIASPSINYISARKSIFPMLIFMGGIIFTILIVLFIRTLIKRERTIRQTVYEKTKLLKEANNKLNALSRTDALTGVSNRRKLDEFFAREWSRSIRNNSNISFILLDIDFFKNYNDNYGHLAGDECLRMVATELNTQVKRPGDLLARYGGEEFAIILSDTTNAEAVVVANNCMDVIKNLQIPHDFSAVANRITISIGICTIIPQADTNSSLIISTADKALYKAKENGRNRVVNGTSR